MKRRAEVVDTRAPDGSMRARVRINGINDAVPVEQLPWAEYQLDMSFTFKPAQIGDQVWVEFPYDGDSRRPLIVGGAMNNYGGVPNVSGAASGNDPLTPPETEGTPPFPVFDSTADMVYDRNGLVVGATADGSFIVMNRNTGAVVFMNGGGDLAVNIPGILSGFANGGYDVKTPAMFKVDAAGGIELKSAAKVAVTGDGGVDLTTGATLAMTAGNIAANKG